MKKLLSSSIVVILLGGILFSFKNSKTIDVWTSILDEGDTLNIATPVGWKEPVYSFKENPVTKDGFILGRQLFYDPWLSKDSTISCASCHLSYTGFTHIDHALSHGIEDRIGKRNTKAIINPAWQQTFMWDGGVNNLEVQPLSPITSTHEMDNTLKEIVDRLNQSKKYRAQFNKVFNLESEITGQQVLKVLAQFMATFVSANSKYDKVMRKEEGFAFTEREERGLKVFRQQCASCHTEPLFTNESFENNGLSVNPFLKDYGRYIITKASEDSLKFKVPTLRNIEATYPYMHDGRFRSLQSVLHHYTNGVTHSPTLSNKLPLKMTEEEKRDLIGFLKTLTDMEFLRNKDLAFPVK